MTNDQEADRQQVRHRQATHDQYLVCLIPKGDGILLPHHPEVERDDGDDGHEPGDPEARHLHGCLLLNENRGLRESSWVENAVLRGNGSASCAAAGQGSVTKAIPTKRPHTMLLKTIPGEFDVQTRRAKRDPVAALQFRRISRYPVLTPRLVGGG